MRAMILAAGLGTRLRPLTEQIPKPMMEVAGVPNIERQIVHLRSFGITRFAINLHHCPQPLMQHLGTGGSLGVEIEYFFEPQILGTGGGIRRMISSMGDETFVVCNGDALYMPDLPRLLWAHRKGGRLASMVVRKTGDAANPGNVGLSSTREVSRLIHFGDQTTTDLYQFTGLHIIEPEIAPLLTDSGCIVRQSYIPMLESGLSIQGIVDSGFFADIGTPADYLDANLRIIRGEEVIPGFFPRSDKNLIADSAQLGTGCKIENSIVGRDVTIQNNVRVCQSIVLDGAVVTKDVRNSIIMRGGVEIQLSAPQT